MKYDIDFFRNYFDIVLDVDEGTQLLNSYKGNQLIATELPKTLFDLYVKDQSIKRITGNIGICLFVPEYHEDKGNVPNEWMLTFTDENDLQTRVRLIAFHKFIFELPSKLSIVSTDAKCDQNG